MSSQRKNSKALKTLRRAGLAINGNFLFTHEAVVNSTIAGIVARSSTIVDEARLIMRLDPMEARRIANAWKKDDPTPKRAPTRSRWARRRGR